MTARGFLRDRYQIWHHAMRKLVPEIMIPYNILDNLICKDFDVVMELIHSTKYIVNTE